MRPAKLRRLMNLWPPFLFSGIRVTHVADDWLTIRSELKLRSWNRNYVGTHFGGSLFSMTDPFYMLMLVNKLGPSYYVWDKSSEIDFVKPGRGVVSAEFHIQAEDLAAIRKATENGEKYLHWFNTQIEGQNGEVVARVRKQVYIRLKPKASPTAS